MLFDRNNHKAAHHGALILGGGIPVYLETDRNAARADRPDLPGGLRRGRHPRGASATNPLVTDKTPGDAPRPFRVAVVEQCTYDGTILQRGA